MLVLRHICEKPKIISQLVHLKWANYMICELDQNRMVSQENDV